MLETKYQILTFKRQRTNEKRLTPVHSKKRQVVHGMCLQGHISQVNAVENTPSASGQAPQPPRKGFSQDPTAVPRPFMVHPMLVCSSWCTPCPCVLPGACHSCVSFLVYFMLMCLSRRTLCSCALPGVPHALVPFHLFKSTAKTACNTRQPSFKWHLQWVVYKWFSCADRRCSHL